MPDVRQAVVRALGDLGDARATQALLLALRDNVAEVKIEALSALGRLRAPEAVDAIAPLALERNPGVRQAALVALGRIATPGAVRALIKTLGTQEDATGTLERTPARDALVASGKPAIPELTALLERPVTPAIATSAAWVLGELHATASAPAIVAALRKGTLPAAAALQALAGAGTPDQVPVVLEFVSDPSPQVREAALAAATALLDPARPDGRAVEPLAATLRNSRTSPDERAKVAMLLGRTGAPRAATELAGLVSAKDTTLRLAAIDALGALGSASPAIDDALVPLLADTDPAVRLHTAVALGASGGPKARGALLGKLAGGEEVDRFAVLTALGGIVERHPDDGVVRRIFEQLGIAAGPERDAVIQAGGRARLGSAVNALGAIAKSADVDDRRAVASVLATHKGSQAALAIARGLAADADSSVRAEAAFALGSLGDMTLLPYLVQLAKGGDADVATNAVAAIARIAGVTGKSAAPAISATVCSMLNDGRATVRANALVALSAASARCQDGRAERKILAEDASDLARAAAARAIMAAPVTDDRIAIDRCAAADRSAEVARLCRPRTNVPAAPRRAQAVTVFVIGETGGAAKPHASFLLEYEGGVLRAGTADRRGATFDPVAPNGDLVLRRAPSR